MKATLKLFAIGLMLTFLNGCNQQSGQNDKDDSFAKYGQELN